MGGTSKELLQLEHKNPSTSSLESAVLVCKSESQEKKINTDEKPTIAPVPRSQFLGKVKDFLGVISEANEKLQLDAQDNSKSYDIEALDGNESQVIEMDLMLGITDLRTPDAVAAAESAIAGCQPRIPLAVSSSGTESDDSGSDEEENEIDKNDHGEEDGSENEDVITILSTKHKRSKSAKAKARKKQSEKKPKIVEL
ncbi:uncharacterized protein LOC133786196 [Humulus lupulus]|uniref:uncharacterized protein LOC133786196 n=1 Tax=Humulus lupulus TaxID=3486 RepID=UPI002B40046F|nr:uncharacterized protein LOC133786196 [Humulus lupulus]